jgi:hypothetical protein
MPGAYLSLKRSVASAAFFFLSKEPVPKTAGAAKIAACSCGFFYEVSS